MEGERKVDAIVWCTGYSFSYPFLNADCGVSVEMGRRVRPLYKHLFHARRPSMSFVGVPNGIAPFPLFDRQVQMVVAVISGRVKLPPCAERLAWEKADYQRRLDYGMKPHYAHVLGDWQWEYNTELARIVGIDDLPGYVRKLYLHLRMRRCKALPTYRDEEYRIVDDDNFEAVTQAD